MGVAGEEYIEVCESEGDDEDEGVGFEEEEIIGIEDGGDEMTVMEEEGIIGVEKTVEVVGEEEEITGIEEEEMIGPEETGDVVVEADILRPLYEVFVCGCRCVKGCCSNKFRQENN